MYLSEKDFQDFLGRYPDGNFTDIETDLEEILQSDKHVSPDLTTEQRIMFVEGCLLRREAFSVIKSFSPPNNAKQYKIPLKKDYKIVRRPKPKYLPGSAKTKFETMWIRYLVGQGQFEFSPRSLWVQYSQHVKKSKKGKNDPNWVIRVCGNYVGSNKQQEKLPNNVPDMKMEAARHKGHYFYWTVDGTNWYRQTVIHPDSRDILAVWTPLGIARPIRMQYGDVNVGIIAQENADETLGKLKPETRERISNYQDDMMGGAPTVEIAMDDFFAFLKR